MIISKLKKKALHLTHKLNLNSLLGVAILFVVASLVVGSVQAIQENFQRQLEVDRLAQEVEILKIEVKTMELENQYYQSDEYLELQARELLGLAQSGEKAIMLPKNNVDEKIIGVSSESSQTPIEERSNLSQWLYFLFSDK